MTRTIILAGAGLLTLAGTALAQPAAPGRLAAPAQVTRAEATARADAMFTAMDVDRDGRVTREEARQAHAQRRALRAERTAERLAGLTPERRAAVEARRAERRERMANATPEQRARFAERRAGRGGARGAGADAAQAVMTLEQFRARALARFDRADANNDGIVTREERQAQRSQRRGPRGGGRGR